MKNLLTMNFLTIALRNHRLKFVRLNHFSATNKQLILRMSSSGSSLGPLAVMGWYISAQWRYIPRKHWRLKEWRVKSSTCTMHVRTILAVGPTGIYYHMVPSSDVAGHTGRLSESGGGWWAVPVTCISPLSLVLSLLSSLFSPLLSSLSAICLYSSHVERWGGSHVC